MGVKDELNGSQNSGNSGENDLLQFFIGIILLGVGLFLFFKRVTVSSGFFSYGLRFGSFGVPSGLVVVPFIIGIIWFFINSESVIPKIIITLGVIIIVASIIMSTRIYFERTTLFDYLLMIGMSAAGFGLILKNVFKKK